jgi:hypothetical protein
MKTANAAGLLKGERKMDGIWVGFAAVVGPVVLLGVFFWFRFRARKEMQDTIRIALDKGQELSPELIDRLAHPKPSKNKDLRLGVIWLAIAVGFALMAAAVSYFAVEAFYGTLAASALPLAIGLGYLLIHFVTGGDE